VSAASLADIDELVASVGGLFQEDGGRHDPFLDTGWPPREGTQYYRPGGQARLSARGRP
jgi:hypothetical protein